jgi:hypothetical protein
MGARTAETKSCGPQVVTSSGYGRSGSSSVKMPAHSCIGRLGRGAGSGRAVMLSAACLLMVGIQCE